MLEPKSKITQYLHEIITNLSPNSKPKLSWKKPLSLHIIIILSFVLNIRKRFFARYLAKRSLNELRKGRRGLRALVIANGPSAKKLDLNKIKQMQANHSLDVFVINSFFKFTVNKKFKADFLVLSDPIHNPNSNLEISTMLWKWVGTQENLKIICPTTWCDDFTVNKLKSTKRYYFNDFESLIPTSKVNPVKPRGYLSMTVLKAIAVASTLGYEQIYLIGADNTQYKGLSGSINNDIYLEPEHLVKNYHHVLNATKIYGCTTADFFADVSRSFFDFTFFKDLNIINLDPQSLVDVFPKSEDSYFLKHKYLKTKN